MTEKQTHTPTPWWIVEHKEYGLTKRYITGKRRIGEVFNWLPLSPTGEKTWPDTALENECAANAEFIVRAANSHDALVNALRDLLAEASGQPKSCGHDFNCTCPYDNARNAIRKATT